MSRPKDGLTAGEALFCVLVTMPGMTATDAVVQAFPKIKKRVRAGEYAKKLLARPCVAETVARIRAQDGELLTIEKAEIVSRLAEAFRKASTDGGDLAKLGKLLADLLGSYAPRKHEHSGLVSIEVVDPYASPKGPKGK